MKKTETTKYYIAASVALTAFVAYLSSLQHQFILWDDDRYVYENLHIRSLNVAFLRWAFFDFHAGNWHPLTWMSHALDYAIWGLNPMGHHLTNNILHAINTFVVVLLTTKLLELGRRPTEAPQQLSPHTSHLTIHDSRFMFITAATTGLLFGLHPLHVESVAWLSERKDLLCALFFLLSIMAYTKYASRGGPLWTPREGQPLGVAPTRNDPGQAGMTKPGSQFLNRYYLLSLVFFILALLSKSMAVTLPAVLLLLDWYPAGRVRSLRTFRTVIVEKLPFIALSLVSSLLTVLAQKAGSALASMDAAPLSMRLLVGVRSLMAYLWKMVLPVNLVPFYPYPKEASLASVEYLSAIVLVIGITIACIVMARRQKLWISVWGYYVIMLIPVLGIVQVGQQSMADRYTYLPSLGPFLLMGVAAAWVWARAMQRGSSIAKLLAVAVSASLIISLSYLTFRQAGIWKNSIVFWSYVIEKEPEKVPVAYYNRGIAFDKMGLSDKAIADYDEAIALNPDYYDAYNNRGLAYEKKGLFEEAIKDLETAMAMKPSSPEAYNNLGKIYRRTGQFDRAMENYNSAIALKPSYDEAYFNRAIVYEKTGQFDKAIENYNRAIALNPSYYEAYNNLGVLYGNTGSVDEAIEHFSQAILLNQTQSGPYLNRGILYAKTGKKGLAVSDFQRACELGNKAGCSALDAVMRGQAG